MAFIARTNLDFDRMLPAGMGSGWCAFVVSKDFVDGFISISFPFDHGIEGFEDELDLEDTSGNKARN
jgi:hypothetical protein